MSLEDFEKLNNELSKVTKELAYHVVGDPLVLSNLSDYLDISLKNGLKVNITTAANKFSQTYFDKLNHPALKQINFSVNAYNGGSFKITLEEYLTPIFDFCKYSIESKVDYFINIRLWNFDDKKSAKEFNKTVFKMAKEYFDANLNIEEFYVARPKNVRVERKIFFHFDEYFDWPSLNNEFVSEKGFCYGLDSHFGVLANGDVVPCCLDKDGIIKLGNAFEVGVLNVLQNEKTTTLKQNFKDRVLSEELCRKCSYRTRFD